MGNLASAQNHTIEAFGPTEREALKNLIYAAKWKFKLAGNVQIEAGYRCQREGCSSNHWGCSLKNRSYLIYSEHDTKLSIWRAFFIIAP